MLMKELAKKVLRIVEVDVVFNLFKTTITDENIDNIQLYEDVVSI